VSFNRFCSIGHRGACERKGRHSASWPRATPESTRRWLPVWAAAAAEVADAAPATALRPEGPSWARVRRCRDCPRAEVSGAAIAVSETAPIVIPELLLLDRRRLRPQQVLAASQQAQEVRIRRLAGLSPPPVTGPAFVSAWVSVRWLRIARRMQRGRARVSVDAASPNQQRRHCEGTIPIRALRSSGRRRRHERLRGEALAPAQRSARSRRRRSNRLAVTCSAANAIVQPCAAPLSLCTSTP
jgi:hypothetical protein